MTAIGKRAIVERIQAIAEWRRERELQDMLGLGPEAAQRSRRSADGLRELADVMAALADDDERIVALERLAFSGEVFSPGAMLLTELGRFRFHDAEQEIESFVAAMVSFAERDVEEMGLWGGAQVEGDNPWRANWTVSWEEEEENW
ncbi:MAG: hypothetical protein M9953_01355 [Thermomicrobiales bacterium]|nr:hypothetical protein [Thermomicrobiales bacterium]MCO5217478.1 hypothetical protein [Thermomicrobiales bacterium]MCO5223959.1 hypothetical protein [Thermomicrobiales bacterium]MCO5226773.1 hypothetical protein [Thermomicrobiales bacterium]